MMRALLSVGLLAVVACGPARTFQPFIHVTVIDQEGLQAPDVDTFEVTLSSVLNGNIITDVLEFEVPSEQNPLPTDFVVLFSEQVRGQNVDIVVRGLVNGAEVFTATTSATADIAEVEATARFCGDQTTDDDRGETCDDGTNNSNILPDACRIDCQIASCGDLVVDTGETCDDGNAANEDSCNDQCQSEFCGDGVLQPALGEACDDGANNSDTLPGACRTNCRLATCGDGALDQGEECDDGNNAEDDGCEPSCLASVIQIAAGGLHTCALSRSGNVRCWGESSAGRLGYGNTNDIGDNEAPSSAGPVEVGGEAIQIATGEAHTCALLNTGNVRCWGQGTLGRLGYGNTNSIGFNETPASAGDVNIGGTVIQITAGTAHTCALLSTGNVRCWGSGASGRLGYGNTNDIGDDEPPNSVGSIDVGGTVVQIAAGNEHTCALLDTGEIRCWGNAITGGLGYGNTNDIGDDETPATAGNIDVGGSAVQIDAGSFSSCALLDTGGIRCWGSVSGYGNTDLIGDDEAPSSAGDIDVGGAVIQISTKGAFCALLDIGNVLCWGLGDFGQLGYGNTNDIGDNETPASAGSINIGGPVVQVAAGRIHTCALLNTGRIRCWGLSSSGQLGYGNTNTIGDNETPASAGDIPLF